MILSAMFEDCGKIQTNKKVKSRRVQKINEIKIKVKYDDRACSVTIF